MYVPFFSGLSIIIENDTRRNCSPHFRGDLRCNLYSVAKVPRKSAQQFKRAILRTVASSPYENIAVDASQRSICRNDVYRVLNMVHVSFLGILGTGLYICFSSCVLKMLLILTSQLYYQEYIGYSPIRTTVRLVPMFISGIICNIVVASIVGRVPMIYLVGQLP